MAQPLRACSRVFWTLQPTAVARVAPRLRGRASCALLPKHRLLPQTSREPQETSATQKPFELVREIRRGGLDNKAENKGLHVVEPLHAEDAILGVEAPVIDDRRDE